MKNKHVVIVLVFATFLVGAGVIFFTSGMANSPSSTQPAKIEPTATTAETGETTATSSQSSSVIIENFEFIKKDITVKKGTTVVWKNLDTAKHNVIFDDVSVGQVEGGKLIGKGQELSFTFDKVGSFSYFCGPHTYMKGRVVVSE